jgi:hypothetical protein
MRRNLNRIYAIRVVSDDCKTELKVYFRVIEKDSAEVLAKEGSAIIKSSLNLL